VTEVACFESLIAWAAGAVSLVPAAKTEHSSSAKARRLESLFDLKKFDDSVDKRVNLVLCISASLRGEDYLAHFF